MQLALFIVALLIMMFLAMLANPIGVYGWLESIADWLIVRGQKEHEKLGHGIMPIEQCKNEKCVKLVKNINDLYNKLGR